MNTNVIKKANEKDYVIVPYNLLVNPLISARAKGLYCYIISLLPDKTLRLSDLPSHFTEGRDALQTAFKELEKNNFIEKSPTYKKDTRQLNGWNFVVKEVL